MIKTEKTIKNLKEQEAFCSDIDINVEKKESFLEEKAIKTLGKETKEIYDMHYFKGGISKRQDGFAYIEWGTDACRNRTTFPLYKIENLKEVVKQLEKQIKEDIK